MSADPHVAAHEDLVALEREGWAALSTGGDVAAAFYDAVLAEQVLALLPGGLVIHDRAALIDAMAGPPWSSFDLADARVLDLGAGAAVVAYRATAQRDGAAYTALFNSTYVRRADGWRLAVHQQTPV